MEERQAQILFGVLLSGLRKKADLTQDKLAESSGLSKCGIGRLERGERRRPRDDTLEMLANALKLTDQEREDFFKAGKERRHSVQKLQSNACIEEWGWAPDVANEAFFGREGELKDAESFILDKRCKVLAILGMPGIGKTRFAIKLANIVKHEFDYLYWCTLENAPPLEKVILRLTQTISKYRAINLPEDINSQIEALIRFFHEKRCLLIFDSYETILQGQKRGGSYRQGYYEYGVFLKLLGEVHHHSCVMLTSTEKPKEIARIEGKSSSVQAMLLTGLNGVEGREIIESRGLRGSDELLGELVSHYSGNPLALRLAAGLIGTFFAADISSFLIQGAPIMGELDELLHQQFERLSDLEQEIMYWLAVEREEITLDEIQADLIHPVPIGDLMDAMDSLMRRSMIESRSAGHFALQSVILGHITNRLVKKFTEEIDTETMDINISHALIKAHSKNYVLDSQMRFLLNPVAEHLLNKWGKDETEQKLRRIISKLRQTHANINTYACGNVLNLMIWLKYDLRGCDFSHLVIKEAYLRGAALPETDFSQCLVENSPFTDTFGGILSVDYHKNGKLLAASTTSGEVRIWQILTGKLIFSASGHPNWIWSVAFSPDGKLVASGGGDHVIRIWDISTSQCLKILVGHTHPVRSIAFSPDGATLASTSDDRTVRLWEIESGHCRLTISGHYERVRSVAFSPDGQMVISGSDDRTVRLWDVSTGYCLTVFSGHTDQVRSVAFSSDERTVASGGDDQTVRLWDIKTGQCLLILQGHTNQIRSVAFSPDGGLVASASDDQTVRLWDVIMGQCINVLQGHTNQVRSVIFSSDGKMLISGSDDQTARTWEVKTGACISTIQGYSLNVWSVAMDPARKLLASSGSSQAIHLWNLDPGRYLTHLSGHSRWVCSVAFSPDGKLLASCSNDQTIRLWDAETRQCLNILRGHSRWVCVVAFNPNGKLIASGSDDQTIRLWDVLTGRCRTILQGHTNWVRTIAFSPNGKLLASGSDDQTIRLWDLENGQCVQILTSHQHQVLSVAFSPNGKFLASGSEDQTIRLWDVETGQEVTVFSGHTRRVWSVVFSPDGSTIVSGSGDHTIRIWDIGTGNLLRILEGHSNQVRAVTFSQDGSTLVSGSEDGSIILWERASDYSAQILRAERPYEQMRITGVMGLSDAQRSMLKELGAIE